MPVQSWYASSCSIQHLHISSFNWQSSFTSLSAWIMSKRLCDIWGLCHFQEGGRWPQSLTLRTENWYAGYCTVPGKPSHQFWYFHALLQSILFWIPVYVRVDLSMFVHVFVFVCGGMSAYCTVCLCMFACAVVWLFVGCARLVPTRWPTVFHLPRPTAVHPSLWSTPHHRSPGQGASGHRCCGVNSELSRLLRRVCRQRVLPMPRQWLSLSSVIYTVQCVSYVSLTHTKLYFSTHINGDMQRHIECSRSN